MTLIRKVKELASHPAKGLVGCGGGVDVDGEGEGDDGDMFGL